MTTDKAVPPTWWTQDRVLTVTLRTNGKRAETQGVDRRDRRWRIHNLFDDDAGDVLRNINKIAEASHVRAHLIQVSPPTASPEFTSVPLLKLWAEWDVVDPQ